MKKVIAIVAVIAIAFVGLTSYNGSTEKKSGNDRLLAELKTTKSGDPITKGGGGKKLD
jgi:hypothetical protein